MKRTKIYPGHVKPVRVGVYERMFSGGTWAYSFWNGQLWSVAALTPNEALNDWCWVSSMQSLPWRGLTKDHS